MKRETIIQMAREAGFTCLLPDEAIDMIGGVFTVEENIYTQLERFADAIRAATKEEDAKICDALSMGFHSPHEYIEDCAEAIRASK